MIRIRLSFTFMSMFDDAWRVPLQRKENEINETIIH